MRIKDIERDEDQLGCTGGSPILERPVVSRILDFSRVLTKLCNLEMVQRMQKLFYGVGQVIFRLRGPAPSGAPLIAGAVSEVVGGSGGAGIAMSILVAAEASPVRLANALAAPTVVLGAPAADNVVSKAPDVGVGVEVFVKGDASTSKAP